MAVPKSRGLWDSDDEDVVLSLGKVKIAKESQQSRNKPSLFDSGDEDDTFLSKGKTNIDKKASTLFDNDDNEAHFKKLYLSEMAKRKELESQVTQLEAEIVSLKEKLMQALPHKPIEEANNDAEWEALAREEKQRRQRAIQQKAARNRTSSKRPVGATAAVLTSIDPTEGSVASVVPPAAKVPQVGHYLDSDEGEEQLKQTIPAMNSNTSSFDVSEPNQEPLDDVVEPVSKTSVPAIVSEETVTEDPDIVKWRELAAQEKARKALARRSVRVVRRGGANNNYTNVESSANDGPVKHKHLLLSAYTQMKNSNSFQNLAGATATTTAGDSVASVSGQTSQSIPSGASSTSAGTIAAGATVGVRGQSYSYSDSESDWDSESQSDSSESTNGDGIHTSSINATALSATSVGTTGISATNSSIDNLTATEEAALDRRLRTWAGGKSITYLLCTLPTIVEWSKQEFLVSGEVTTVVEMLNTVVNNSNNEGNSVAGDIRKTYMRVIRHCHPDKHMHLPPRSPAFLELQKIFTILSDSYNRYKATQS